MTYRAVRNQLVSIVSGTTPSVVTRGLPSRFKHDDNGASSDAGDSRRYWLATSSGVAVGPSTTLTRLMTVQLNLVVQYCSDVNSAELDIAIVDDAAQLIRRLANGANWGRPSSSIISVSAIGDRMAPFVVEIDGGVRRLKITLEVRYSHD